MGECLAVGDVKCTSTIGRLAGGATNKTGYITELNGGAAARTDDRLGECMVVTTTDLEVFDTSCVTVDCHSDTNRLATMFNDGCTENMSVTREKHYADGAAESAS